MSSLFDAIKGALVLIGGMRESDLEKEKVQSDTEYKKGLISTARERTAAEQDTAAATRALQERLTTGAWEHQSTEAEKERKFKGEESKLDRNVQIALQTARLEAEVDKYRYENAEQKERLRMELESREKIAEMQRKLQEKGIDVEWAKIAKMMPWQVDFILKAAALAAQGTTGIEGYATGLTSPEAAQKNIDLYNSRFQGLIENIDPDGKLGLKGKVPPLTIKKFGYSESGIPGRNALPGIESRTPPPTATPGITPKFDNTLLPGTSTLTGKPMENASLPIHPKDEFKLNLWSQAIKSLPPAVQGEALREYETVLPSELFEGTAGMSPDQNAAYREGLRIKLRSKTNPYSLSK